MNERANGRNKFIRSEFMNFTFLCQATNEKKVTERRQELTTTSRQEMKIV